MIKSLTSLRFVFALFVFFSHMHMPSDSFGKKLYSAIFLEGHAGVSFFFILSGFILSYSYKDKVLNGAIALKDFYIARIARIFPLHLFTLAVSVHLWMILPGNYDYTIEGMKFLSNLLLVHSFIPIRDFYGAFNAPSWSISNEMFFYMLFPFLLYLLYNRKLPKYLVWLSFLLIPAAMLVVEKDLHQAVFYINPFLRIAEFIIGILLFDIYTKGYFKNTSPWVATVLELSGAVLIMISLHHYYKLPYVFRYSVYYWPGMICIVYFFSLQKGYLSKIFSWPGFIFLGEISFSFYLIHHLVIRYLDIYYGEIWYANWYLGTALALTISLFLSYFSYIWIEKPCNRFLKEAFVKGAKPADVALS